MCGFAPVSQVGCDQTGLCIGKLALRKRSSKTKKRNDTWVVPYNVIVSMLPHIPRKKLPLTNRVRSRTLQKIHLLIRQKLPHKTPPPNESKDTFCIVNGGALWGS